MKLRNILAICLTAAAICALPLPSWAQTPIEAGRTGCGVLYIDAESVQSVKKDGNYYLAFFAEEKYTDAKFLEVLREGEGMEKAASAIYLYLFNTFGSEYFIGASYIVDADGKVCADLGADLALKPVGSDKTMQNAYTMALKIMERKKSAQW